MIEKQFIKGKPVWVQVDAYPLNRPNPNIIPTEYFTASYFFEEPGADGKNGETVNDEEGKVRLFESPVAALSFARKKLETDL
jgi:hypothetical protein